MKLSGRDAKAFFARPDPERSGVLIFGTDAMRVALRRQDMLAALLGPDAEKEMRLERVAAADLRREPALALDAVKSTGFFGGQRAVLVEDATDAAAPALSSALDGWSVGDAMLVVTAVGLTPRSKLRKLFEGHKTAAAAPVYDDPPGRDEIAAELKRAGLRQVDREAMVDLEALARTLDPGDFRQTMEKIALYKFGDESPLEAREVALMAPATLEAELDDLLAAVAGGQGGRIGPLIQRLKGQGVGPVTMIIAAARHFRALHAAAADPQGPAAALSRARPPVFGPRREAMAAQARTWGVAKLETALSLLIDTDLALRSAGQTAPQEALVERLFIRLAMLGQR